MTMADELKPCPFCGGLPRSDLSKITYCSLHGEPSQAVFNYYYHADCLARPKIEAGNVFFGGRDRGRVCVESQRVAA